MRFSMLNVRYSAAYFCSDRPPIADKFVVFGAALGNIARKHSESGNDKQRIRYVHYRRHLDDAVKQGKNKRSNDHRNIEMIRSISASHKITKKVPYHTKAPYMLPRSISL